MTDELRAVMIRELRALAREVGAYPGEAELWQLVPGIANSGGSLALHMAGNIRHFIGAVLGGSGYVRNREAEFGRRDLARAQLIAEIDLAIADVERVLPSLDPASLAGDFPAEIAGRRVPTGRFLTHLAVHLAYHLGQVDYHRRIVAPKSGTVNAMAVSEI